MSEKAVERMYAPLGLFGSACVAWFLPLVPWRGLIVFEFSARCKTTGGRVSYPPPIGWLKVFLAERCAACGCRTGWIGADHTTLVREKSALNH